MMVMMSTLFVIAPILSIIALSIVVVNILTLSTIFTSPQLLKPGNYPIISFLLTALIQGFFVVPAYCIKQLRLDFTSTWICDVFRFPYFVCSHLLTLNLVIVCVDRIIAIRLPLRYDAIVTKCNMMTAICAETVAVLITDMLPFANGNANDECLYVPWPSWSITVVVITVFIPIVFLTLTYAWIWLIALRVAEHAPSTKCDERASLKIKITAKVTKMLELRATKTTSLLVGVFVICWAPSAVYYLVENLCSNCPTVLFSRKAKSIVSLSVKLVSFSSSIISPFVYCWRTREFQREFKRSLTRRHWRAARIALSFMRWAGKEKGMDNSLHENPEGNHDVLQHSAREKMLAVVGRKGYSNCLFDLQLLRNRNRACSECGRGVHECDFESESARRITFDIGMDERSLQITAL